MIPYTIYKVSFTGRLWSFKTPNLDVSFFKRWKFKIIQNEVLNEDLMYRRQSKTTFVLIHEVVHELSKDNWLNHHKKQGKIKFLNHIILQEKELADQQFSYVSYFGIEVVV